MTAFLRQSTSGLIRSIGPFVDDTDGKTPETALTIANTDIKLMINGAAAVDKNSGGATHRANGVYGITFAAADTATVGELFVSVSVAGALPVWARFFVLEEAVYDALFNAGSVGPLTTLGANAPAEWVNAAAIAPDALDGKGDWNVGKTGYSLDATYQTTLVNAIDAALLNAGDATDLIASIVARIGNTNVDEASFVAAVKAALFDAGSIANKLSVDGSGRVNVGINADKSGYSLTEGTGLGNQTANITGNLSGSVGSVTDGATAAALAMVATEVNKIGRARAEIPAGQFAVQINGGEIAVFDISEPTP